MIEPTMRSPGAERGDFKFQRPCQTTIAPHADEQLYHDEKQLCNTK